MPYKKKLSGFEEAFCLHYAKTRNGTQSSIAAGSKSRFPSDVATVTLRRPWVQARIKQLWEKAESDVVMRVLERKEVLSEIGRSVLSDFIDDNGQIIIENLKGHAAVKEVIIEQWRGADLEAQTRSIKIKVHNPIEAIHELNAMEVKMKPGGDKLINPTWIVNVMDRETAEEVAKIGLRTAPMLTQGVTEATEIEGERE
uniref:Putative terminase n=1 Tax=viral metagenome TaxID=1070528 RepID=A0A6M3J3Q1_9ZZZZ